MGAVDRVLRITAIRVRYELKVPPGSREAAQRAVDTHEQKCPAATSVRGCIRVPSAPSATQRKLSNPNCATSEI